MESTGNCKSRRSSESLRNRGSEAPEDSRADTIVSARAHNGNRLSKRLASPFKSFRRSTVGGYLGHSSGKNSSDAKAVRKLAEKHSQSQHNIIISDPVLCTSSSPIHGYNTSDVTARSFHTRPVAPKPPVAINLADNADLVIPFIATNSDQSPTMLSLNGMQAKRSSQSHGDNDKETPCGNLSCDSATLEALPSLFDMFRARAYEESLSPPLTNGEFGPAASGPAAASMSGDRGDDGHQVKAIGAGTQPEILRSTTCSYSPILDSTESEANGSIATSGASTRSTAPTCASKTTEEFYFEDPEPGTRQKGMHPSPTILTWRPEQLVGGEASTDSERRPVSTSAGTVKAGQKEGTPELASMSSNSSIGLPQPPALARRRLKDRAGPGASQNDGIVLLASSEHFGEPGQAAAYATASDASLGPKVDMANVYKEAIARLKEVRQLEVRTLVQRIEQLEMTARLDVRSVDWSQTFYEKIHGLPRLLPVRSSGARRG